LSASANPKIKAGFAPLLPGFVRVPYNDAAAIEQAIQANSDIVAVLLEPVQGNAGIIVPDLGYLQKVRQICDRGYSQRMDRLLELAEYTEERIRAFSHSQ
jgi:acetylornithine/N-succinyldiaminopimelate aminotransferase